MQIFNFAGGASFGAYQYDELFQSLGDFILPAENLHGHGLGLIVYRRAAIDDIAIPPDDIIFCIGGGAAGKYGPRNILVAPSQKSQGTGRQYLAIPGKTARQFKIPFHEQHAATGNAAAKLDLRTPRVVIDDIVNAAG